MTLFVLGANQPSHQQHLQPAVHRIAGPAVVGSFEVFADIDALFATSDKGQNGFTDEIFSRFAVVTHAFERIRSAILSLLQHVFPTSMVGNMELRIQALQSVGRRFHCHGLQVIAQDLIATTLENTRAGERFSQEITDLAFCKFLGGVHCRVRFSSLSRVGNAALVQRGAGCLEVN